MTPNEINSLKGLLMESRKRQEELENTVQELSDFLENGSLPLHWVDGNGKITWANKAELESLGYSKDEYIGHHINEFHADREVIDDILKRLHNKETLNNFPARMKCRDGSIKDVLINSNVLWKDDKFVHTRCFTRDITSIKIEQEKRKALVKELEKKNGELSAYAEQLKAAYSEVESKVKFRNLELERRIKEKDEKIMSLEAQLSRNK
jgi:PAS domain S-box-containing protein